MKLIAVLANRRKPSASADVRRLLGVGRKDAIIIKGPAGAINERVYRVPLAAASLEQVCGAKAIFLNRHHLETLGVAKGGTVNVTSYAHANAAATRTGGVAARLRQVLTTTPQSAKDLASRAGLTDQQVRDCLRNTLDGDVERSQAGARVLFALR